MISRQSITNSINTNLSSLMIYLTIFSKTNIYFHVKNIRAISFFIPIILYYYDIIYYYNIIPSIFITLNFQNI